MNNAADFFLSYQDYLAPHLDTYEQAIYLYVYRHSRLIDKEDVVIGFKSARSRMAFGIGEKGKPMSEGTAYKKLAALSEKGYIQIIDSERAGQRIRLKLPSEIPGIIPRASDMPTPTLEDLDFFNVPENRKLIVEREASRCFYCLRTTGIDNYVIEHVVSRPDGDNSYRNVVAACRECNNRKGDMPAEDFIRLLYRENLMNSTELSERLEKLRSLKDGHLKPKRAG